MLKKHEEYLRKSQHEWNFKRLNLHFDFQWFFFSPFPSYQTWEKCTNLISVAQELMKAKVRGRIIQMNALYLNESIDRTLKKRKNNTDTHSHNTLLRVPQETKHSSQKKKVRLNFLINSFLSISKAIMDKVQGQLSTGFKRKCGRMRQRWHQNKRLFIWNITVHQPTIWKLTGTESVYGRLRKQRRRPITPSC